MVVAERGIAERERRAEENKALIRRYIATWNRGDLEQLAEFWAPSMRHHTRGQTHSVESVKRIVADFAAAFSDLKFHLDDIIAENDRVVTRMTARARHTGPYLGMPPTGKSIQCTLIGVARVQDGKIAEHWGVTDELAIASQLGLVPQEFLEAMA
jgi:steroid delta-isomerase-like uncharacterized protein